MNQNKYTTTSLALAAAIQAVSQSKLLSVEKTSGRQFTFIFSATSDLPNTIEEFWNRMLFVDALSYFEAMKYIKARLYESGENEN